MTYAERAVWCEGHAGVAVKPLYAEPDLSSADGHEHYMS